MEKVSPPGKIKIIIIKCGIKRGISLLVLLVAMVSLSWSQELVLDRVVALVNNRAVLISDINQYLSRVLPKSSPLEVQADVPPSRERIIQQLIDEELIQQEAERLKIQVTQEDFEKTFEELKKQNRMTTSQFILALAKEGVPFQQFCNELRREIRKSMVIRSQVINRIVITEEMIKELYEARKDKHSGSQKIRLRQIFQPFRPDLSEEEKKALRLKMDGILTLIKKEGDFDLVEKKYFEGPDAIYSGDMGWIQLKDIASPLAEAIRKLKKGEISGLIESQRGLHIIKVEDTEQKTGPPPAELKESLRQELFEKEFQKRYQAWIKSLRDSAHIEIRR
jgi:peptidyl-prolyl cis-trans isomerase SurA